MSTNNTSTRSNSPLGRRVGYIFLLAIAFAFVCAFIFLFKIATKEPTSDDHKLTAPKKWVLRRSIVDRNGYPLALDVPTYDLVINPHAVISSGRLAETVGWLQAMQHQLAEPIPKDIAQKIKDRHKSRYFRLLKKIAPATKEKLQQWINPSLFYWELRSKRFYPAGDMFANLVGLLDTDGNGQVGLEKKLDKQLRNGSQQPLHISVDVRLQAIASHYLRQAVEDTSSQAGVVFMLDARTGEILANSVFPYFNPNNRSFLDVDNIRNIAFMAQFDPGSTIKPLIMASVFNSGNVSLANEVDITPGVFRINDEYISDPHIADWRLSVLDVIVESSNIGISKLALAMPTADILRMLDRFGLGYMTEVGFPGELVGFLRVLSTMQDVELASMAYGYGVEVTMAQLASAYQSIANDGVRMPLSILPVDGQTTGYRLLSKKIARDIKIALEGVVHNTKGTGSRARIAGYRVGGKTGTVRRYSRKNKSYGETHRVLFVGMAPIDNPDLVVAVMLDKPQTEPRSGGSLAAPLFAKITKEALRMRRLDTAQKLALAELSP